MALLLVTTSCVVSSPGIEVGVTVAVQRPAPSTGGWAIVDGSLGVGSVRLHPCENAVARSMLDRLVPQALAHGPLDQDVDTVRVSLSGASDVALPALTPAPGRYCAVELSLAPLPEGGSLRARLLGPHEATPHPVRWDGGATALSFLAAPLEVRTPDEHPVLVLSLPLAEWLDSCPEDAVPTEVVEHLLTSFETGLRAEVR